MCQFLTAMMPALSPEERTAMLGGTNASAPPEIFEPFRPWIYHVTGVYTDGHGEALGRH